MSIASRLDFASVDATKDRHPLLDAYALLLLLAWGECRDLSPNTGDGTRQNASFSPSMGATPVLSVREYEYKPSGRATVTLPPPAPVPPLADSGGDGAESTRTCELTYRPSRSCRADGADRDRTALGFRPGGGIS